MAYLSIIADSIGVITGIYVAYVGGKSYLQNRKRKPDEDDKNPDQEK